MMRTTVLLAALFVGACFAVDALGNIETLDDLYDQIVAGPNRRVGFISQANYESVSTVLPAEIEVVIVSHTADLIENVESGALIGGLISGVPPNADNTLHTFSSTLISPRAVMFPSDPVRSADMVDAIDAAMVRLQHSGRDHAIARAHPPFEFVAVHTCRTDNTSFFPFPSATTATGDLADALAARKFKMAALGPHNWGEDGDYTQEPHTGFWPDYVLQLQAELQAAYGSDMVIERRWGNSSADVLGDMIDGHTHFTEPYYTVDALYNSRARKHFFELSCISVAYDSTFFTKRHVSPASSSDDELGVGAIVGICAAAALLCFCVVLIYKERRGDPIFVAPILEPMTGEQPAEPTRVDPAL